MCSYGEGITPKEKAIIAAKAHVFKPLGHPTRLWIAEHLAGGERCVCEFVEKMDVDFSTISKHLSVPKLAGVVVDEKRGKMVCYRLKVPCILKYMPCIEEVVQAGIEDHVDLLN